MRRRQLVANCEHGFEEDHLVEGVWCAVPEGVSDADIRSMDDELFPILLACRECEGEGHTDACEMQEDGCQCGLVDDCLSCGGSGVNAEALRTLLVCPDCDGTGVKKCSLRCADPEPHDGYPCPSCQGTGHDPTVRTTLLRPLLFDGDEPKDGVRVTTLWPNHHDRVVIAPLSMLEGDQT